MPHGQARAAREGAGAERRRRHRPRGHVRRGRLLQGLPGRGRQADHRLRGLRRAALEARPRARDRQRIQPSDPPVPERDRLPQPLLSGLLGLHGGLLCPAPHRLAAAARARRGPCVPVGLPGGLHPAEHPARRLRGREIEGARAARAVRARRLLPRDPGPRHPRRAPGGRGADPPVGGDRHPAGRDQRRALSDAGRRLRPGRADVHPDGQDRGRAEPHALRDAGVLSQERGADARALPRAPRGRRQHREDRGALPIRLRVRQLQAAALQAPRRGDGQLGVSEKALRKRLCRALPRPARDPRAARVRAGHDPPDGLCGLFPDRLGLHRLRQAQRHPGRTRARQRRGQRRELLPAHHRRRPHPLLPVFRALPQPRAREHARHRRGLLRQPPGRGHRLRQPRLRPRPRGADRHLRHHGRPRRHPRRGARAEHELRRDRRGRQAGADDAGRQHHDRRGRAPVENAARDGRKGRARQASDRHGPRARGHAPPRLDPRGRRGHHRPARL